MTKRMLRTALIGSCSRISALVGECRSYILPISHRHVVRRQRNRHHRLRRGGRVRRVVARNVHRLGRRRRSDFRLDRGDGRGNRALRASRCYRQGATLDQVARSAAPMSATSTQDLAERLIQCQDRATMTPPITAGDSGFDVERAYDVLAAINARREAQGWRSIGRKIGFTNRTIWARYGVYQPMWAPVWSHTVQFARNAQASLSLAGFVQPRIEPE